MDGFQEITFNKDGHLTRCLSFREKNTLFYEEVIFMTIKFRNVDTGEIIEIDAFDQEAFDECMSHKNYQLIFE